MGSFAIGALAALIGVLSGQSLAVAMKGKKVAEFDLKGGLSDEAVENMLGPTGNLRAPTIKTGQTVLVGFNDEVFAQQF